MLDDPDRHDPYGQRLVRRDADRARRRRRVRRQRIGVLVLLVAAIAAAVVLIAGPFSDSASSPGPSVAAHTTATTTATTRTASTPAATRTAPARTTPARTTTTPRGPSAGQQRLARQAAQEGKAIDHVLTYTPWVTRGSKKKKEIALTFDDGPSIYTPRIMRILRREKVPATFFELGSQIGANRALVRQQAREGFVIGDHTESHANLGTLKEAAQRDQIGTPVEWLHKFGLPRPRLFRPPYGVMNDTTVKVLRRKRMLAVLWSVDTEDWRRPGTRKIIDAAISGADHGAIILMHDGGGDREQTIAALPRIIHGLRKRGYKLVSVPQLMAGDPPPKKLPRPGLVVGG